MAVTGPAAPTAWAGRAPGRGGRRTRRAVGVALVGLLAALGVAGHFFLRAVRLEETARLAENDAIARSTSALLESRVAAQVDVLVAYASRFRDTVKRRARAEALVHLRQLRATFPALDQPFLADPDGIVWAVDAEAPEPPGPGLERDWYRGVSRAWEPYVSEVYARSGDGALAVALAVPIRDLDRTPLGVLVAAQRLEVISRWLQPIRVPGGDLFVVDRRGQLVFHRTRRGPGHVGDYRGIPVVGRLLAGEEGVAQVENPVEGEVRLSAFRRVPALGGGLVVQRERNRALHRTRTLVLVATAAGLVLTTALAVLGAVALRNQRETEHALAALEVQTRELQETQEELVRKERLAILGQLAGGVSHELRNPLGVIKNAVYYLRMVLPEDDERVQKHLRILEREGAAANRIADELLDFARTRPPSRASVDLNVVTRDAVDRLPAADGVVVALDLAPDLPPVAADPDQTRQVLSNLLLNAAQAMPDGGTLTVETRVGDGGAVVAVADTGTGIAPEQLEKVFQPLFTTKAKGIGLGLAVARRLAEANGATLTVESTVGRGSRFTVRFPAPDR